MSNISEHLYEVFAAILFCFGIAFAISLYTTSMKQSEIVARQEAVRENIAESEDGYQGDNLVSGSTVVANIMADAGSTKTYVDDVEIPKETILDCVEENNPSLLMVSIDPDAEYKISYTEDPESSGVLGVTYTKQ